VGIEGKDDLLAELERVFQIAEAEQKGVTGE
jgi:hypothetical protein